MIPNIKNMVSNIYMSCFRGIRLTLNSHAFLYSLTQTVQYEVLQSQIAMICSSDIGKDLNNMSTIVCIEDLTPIVCLAYLTWFSMANFTEKQIKKLDTILEYKQTRMAVKVSLFIFVHLFFRNVESVF